MKNKDENYYKDLSSNRSKIISNHYFITRTRYIKNHDLSFERFIKKYYFWPYSDWSILSHRKFDAIIKFENLQKDFSEVLHKLNIHQVGQIPLINKTKNKTDVFEHILNSNNEKIINTFLPFMLYWNYDIPESWNVNKIQTQVNIKYKLINVIRKSYWKYIK